MIGNSIKTKIDSNKPITPPSLLGMDRRMAYAKRKYHSGWMCGGVTNGLAGIKFSTSHKTRGFNVMIRVKTSPIIIKVSLSFIIKKGWNGIFSRLELLPRGLDDPFSWRNIKCITTKLNDRKGIIKCSEKKRVKVGLSTEYPPHTHTTIVLPRTGMADNKFVITVAPQNDIWPQGSTYPKKAIPITLNKINKPVIHTGLLE